MKLGKIAQGIDSINRHFRARSGAAPLKLVRCGLRVIFTVALRVRLESRLSRVGDPLRMSGCWLWGDGYGIDDARVGWGGVALVAGFGHALSVLAHGGVAASGPGRCARGWPRYEIVTFGVGELD